MWRGLLELLEDLHGDGPRDYLLSSFLDCYRDAHCRSVTL